MFSKKWQYLRLPFFFLIFRNRSGLGNVIQSIIEKKSPRNLMHDEVVLICGHSNSCIFYEAHFKKSITYNLLLNKKQMWVTNQINIVFIDYIANVLQHKTNIVNLHTNNMHIPYIIYRKSSNCSPCVMDIFLGMRPKLYTNFWQDIYCLLTFRYY